MNSGSADQTRLIVLRINGTATRADARVTPPMLAPQSSIDSNSSVAGPEHNHLNIAVMGVHANICILE